MKRLTPEEIEALNPVNDGYAYYQAFGEAVAQRQLEQCQKYLADLEPKISPYALPSQAADEHFTPPEPKADESDEILIGTLESLADKLDVDKDLAEIKALGYAVDIIKSKADVVETEVVMHEVEVRVCARCGKSRTDIIGSGNVCGNCADDLRDEQDAQEAKCGSAEAGK